MAVRGHGVSRHWISYVSHGHVRSGAGQLAFWHWLCALAFSGTEQPPPQPAGFVEPSLAMHVYVVVAIPLPHVVEHWIPLMTQAYSSGGCVGHGTEQGIVFEQPLGQFDAATVC